jgi:hypothetical protein
MGPQAQTPLGLSLQCRLGIYYSSDSGLAYFFLKKRIKNSLILKRRKGLCDGVDKELVWSRAVT